MLHFLVVQLYTATNKAAISFSEIIQTEALETAQSSRIKIDKSVFKDDVVSTPEIARTLDSTLDFTSDFSIDQKESTVFGNLEVPSTNITFDAQAVPDATFGTSTDSIFGN